MARILVVHPPVSVARDFIDYPYFADLGAVQLAAVLRQGDHAVDLVDAYALGGSSLSWRDDGRAHLGAPVAEVLERCRRLSRGTASRWWPTRRSTGRPGATTSSARCWRGCGANDRGAIVLADLYQSGQHYVEAGAREVLASYPEAVAWVKYEGEAAVPALLDRLLAR